MIYPFIKRAMDIFGATFGLVILSPLLLLVARLIRLTMGKPIIFKQIRPRLNEMPFTIYEFHTSAIKLPHWLFATNDSKTITRET